MMASRFLQSLTRNIGLKYFSSTRKLHTEAEAVFSLPNALHSIVEISVAARETSAAHPWVTPIKKCYSGSGFVISNKRIITNAHVVSGYSIVKVKKYFSGKHFEAKVRVFGHIVDLAILTVDKEEFWDGLVEVDISTDLPKIAESIHIVGFPAGGDNVCVTQGIVSRICTSHYIHSKLVVQLPVIQTDAAINGGNSGGPVFLGNKLIGIAFQSYEELENAGFVIPSPLLLLFLRYSNKSRIGFCSLGIDFQAMDNPVLRSYFKMKRGMNGVLVTGVKVQSCANDVLFTDDVLMELDSIPIHGDGDVYFKDIVLNLNGYISLKKIDEELSLKVLRKGRILNFIINVGSYEKSPATDYPTPSYFVFGGFVFMPSTDGNVKISQVLECKLNTGFHFYEDIDVLSVNGILVDNIAELCEVISYAKTFKRFVRIDLANGSVIVIKFDGLKKKEAALLKDHKVAKYISEDLHKFFPSL